MPAKISRATVCQRPGLSTSIDYSVQAGLDCLGEDVASSRVGLLLNVGVYRDSNIHEPALASLIQGRMGLNPSPLQGKGREATLGANTFSFDLINGACGFFNAVDVAESFLANGAAETVLVVASDVHPANEPRDGFPYAPVGAAMLLTRGADRGGFQRIVHRTETRGPIGSASYAALAGAGSGGRSAMTVEVEADYAERLRDFAVRSLVEYVDRERIDVARIAYVVAPRHPADLHAALAEVLGIGAERFLDVDARFGPTFSSLPIAGYHLAEEAGLDEGDTVLFVSAGAGLTFGCGLYVA